MYCNLIEESLTAYNTTQLKHLSNEKKILLRQKLCEAKVVCHKIEHKHSQFEQKTLFFKKKK